MNGLAGRDLTSLPLDAAFAVRGGADEKTALKAITITPARMLGLEDRIGSLEEGKVPDILVLNGSPLGYHTYVEQAVVAGKVPYDRHGDKKSTRFTIIRSPDEFIPAGRWTSDVPVRRKDGMSILRAIPSYELFRFAGSKYSHHNRLAVATIAQSQETRCYFFRWAVDDFCCRRKS